jgi:flagellin FlaB
MSKMVEDSTRYSIYQQVNLCPIMNKDQKFRPKTHRRGVIGIEAAIVLIAFVIVAAALSFVVLNMGFSTTQKAKTTIGSGLETSSSVLAVTGSVTGHVNGTAGAIDVLAYPLKVASGSKSVDLQEASVAVKYFSRSISYDDIYEGTLSDAEYGSLEEALAAADTAGLIDNNPLATSGAANPTNTTAIIYWATNENTNDVLDRSEAAVLAIIFSNSDMPGQLDSTNVELTPSIGAAMTVQRNVPTLTDDYQDLS